MPEPEKKKHILKSKTVGTGIGVSVIGFVQSILPDGMLSEDQLSTLLIALGPIMIWLRKVTNTRI